MPTCRLVILICTTMRRALKMNRSTIRVECKRSSSDRKVEAPLKWRRERFVLCFTCSEKTPPRKLQPDLTCVSTEMTAKIFQQHVNVFIATSTSRGYGVLYDVFFSFQGSAHSKSGYQKHLFCLQVWVWSTEHRSTAELSCMLTNGNILRLKLDVNMKVPHFLWSIWLQAQLSPTMMFVWKQRHLFTQCRCLILNSAHFNNPCGTCLT